MTEELKEFQNSFAPYPLQGKIVGKLGAYPANSESNPELKSFWAGQAASILQYHDAEKLIATIIAEMEKIISQLLSTVTLKQSAQAIRADAIIGLNVDN